MGKIITDVLKSFVCWLLGHKWIVVDFAVRKNSNRETINCRDDKCKRCKETRTVNDENAPLVKEFKKMVWEQRRRVIVEKHKNPKEYRLTATNITGGEPFFIKEGIFILDKEVETMRIELLAIGIRNIILIDFICLDEPEPPKEFL